jgi:hypothetical protein
LHWRERRRRRIVVRARPAPARSPASPRNTRLVRVEFVEPRTREAEPFEQRLRRRSLFEKLEIRKLKPSRRRLGIIEFAQPCKDETKIGERLVLAVRPVRRRPVQRCEIVVVDRTLVQHGKTGARMLAAAVVDDLRFVEADAGHASERPADAGLEPVIDETKIGMEGRRPHATRESAHLLDVEIHWRLRRRKSVRPSQANERTLQGSEQKQNIKRIFTQQIFWNAHGPSEPTMDHDRPSGRAPQSRPASRSLLPRETTRARRRLRIDRRHTPQ